MRSTFSQFRFLIPLAILGVAGCDDLGIGSEDPGVSLSFAVPQGGSSSRIAASMAQDTLMGDGHVLDLQDVEIAFSEISLERTESGTGGSSDADSDDDSDGDGSSNERFTRGLVTVKLPIGGGIVTPFVETLPAGSYEELEMNLASIRMVGTYDGQPFTITIPVNAELEMDFSPPLVFDSEDDRLNITIEINALSWFRSDDGVLLDPAKLSSSAQLRALFLSRIRASFHAFEDDDRDADDSDSDSDRDSDRGNH